MTNLMKKDISHWNNQNAYNLRAYITYTLKT